jgi:hypothetical protein
VDVKLGISGAKEIDDVLHGLPQQITHKIIQDANAEASKSLVDTAKLSAPEGPTGNLIDSIGIVKASFARSNELGEIQIGPRRGRYKGHHGHLVEFGTLPRTNKSGANRGQMTPKPFMEPAWLRRKNDVLSVINKRIGVHLWKYMERTLKKFSPTQYG